MAAKHGHTEDTDIQVESGSVPQKLVAQSADATRSEGSERTAPPKIPGALFAIVLTLLAVSAGYMIRLHLRPSHQIPLNKLAAGDDPQMMTNKPVSDHRTYQASVLSNGIQMLNVHDDRAVSSAFAVAVEAGSFDDPQGLPGLAHFCEHMLFLGTEKYPEAVGFDEFMSRNDGYNNAYTASEVTVYYAKLATTAAVQGLDRFADFFHAPLFDQTFLEREVHAIDSEHTKNMLSPSRRVLEVMYSLASEKSPVGRFHTGNMQTLYETPRKKKQDPTAFVKNFFDSHYCPARLHLVTFGPQSVDKQFEAANERFGQIPKGSEECYDKPRKSFAEPKAWPKTSLSKWVDIQGTQPKAQMWVVFSLSDFRKSYASQPLQYISWVFEYAGVGSFFRTLQDTLSLTTDFDVSADQTSAGTSLVFKFELSDKGRQNYELVLDLLFAYIAKLSEDRVDMDLYRSLADLNQLEWDWSHPDGPSKTASDLAEAMTRLPFEDLLSGDAVVSQPDAVIVESILKQLAPDNMNIGFVDVDANLTASKDTSDVKTLPFYGVKHRVRDMKQVLPKALARWESWALHDVTTTNIGEQVRLRVQAAGLPLQQGAEVDPRVPTEILNIPQVSLFNAHMVASKKNVTDRPGTDYDALLFGQRPQLLGGTGEEVIRLAENGAIVGEPEVWHREGWVSTSPKVEVSVALRLPPTESSAHDLMRLNLYDKILHEQMGPRLFDIVSSGVSYDIEVNEYGISFGFSGFQPNLPDLVDMALLELNRGVDTSNRLRYDRVHEETRKDLATYSNMPITYAVADRDLLLTHGPHSRAEMLEAMKDVTPETVASAGNDLIYSKPMQLTSLTMGNFDESQAVHMVSLIAHGVKRPMDVNSPDVSGEIQRVTPVVNPSQPVEIRSLNPRVGDPNDAVVVSVMAGVGTVANRVILGLLGKMLEPLAYNELRTRMQLGYVVHSGLVQISNVQLISCVVQGNQSSADVMEAAVERVYSKLMPEKLQSLSQKEFDTYKAAFQQELLQPPTSFSDEVKHFWSPVAQGGRCFGLRNEMIQFLTTSLKTKATLIDTWNQLMLPEHGVRKKVAVKYFAGETVPSAPRQEEALAVYKAQEIPTASLDILRQEHEQTLTFDRADSVSRARLVKEGGYFPVDLNCELEAPPSTGKAATVEQDGYPHVSSVVPAAVLQTKESNLRGKDEAVKRFLSSDAQYVQ